jgi:hypothetical protein
MIFDKETRWIFPTSSWKTLKTLADFSKLTVDKNFYVGLNKSS